jgi:hypothetical protein
LGLDSGKLPKCPSFKLGLGEWADEDEEARTVWNWPLKSALLVVMKTSGSCRLALGKFVVVVGLCTPEASIDCVLASKRGNASNGEKDLLAPGLL